MLRNAKQNRQLWAIVNKLNLEKEVVEDLAYQFSKGRTKSTRELELMEFDSLVNHLNAIAKGNTPAPATKTDFERGEKMRKRFFSICYSLKWTKDGRLDYPTINKWLLEKSYLKKPLNSYQYNELRKLISQLETLLKKDYAKG